MNINIKKEGDDLFENRLFSYLSKELNKEIKGIRQLRGNVFLVQLPNLIFILKGFNELRKLKVQEAFASSLRKSGFEHSYGFHSFGNHPLFYQNQYFGCVEYIEPYPEPFHYAHENDRREGIELLGKFHANTKELAQSYVTLIPKADLPRKWQERRKEFVNYLPQINDHISKVMTDELMIWTDFSLAGFTRRKKNMYEGTPVILHGDVAHHNFLRSKEGKLYLIDYDLISIGPRVFDMLQYANRILPFLNWNFELLAEVRQLKNWLSNEAFLYGLLFPSDLLREWNRLLRERQSHNRYRLLPIIDMTGRQFEQRKQFSEKVISMLK